MAKQGAKKPTGQKTAAPTIPSSLPPEIPSIVFKQAIPAAPVELKTSAKVLSARINKALAAPCLLAERPVFKIRGTSVNFRSGEILVQLHDAKDSSFATEGESLWLPSVNPV